MKCDSCKHIYCEPPCQSSPYGEYGCAKGHWNGIGETETEPDVDPWKWCRDYVPIGGGNPHMIINQQRIDSKLIDGGGV